MHTTIQRLNGVFSFLTTVTFVLGACIALTSFLIPSNPTSDLKVSNFRVVNGRAPRSGSKATEFAFMNFDLDADLSSLFNWNTKQVITYLVADYSTPKYESNAITLWDKICSTPEEAKIKLHSASQKYRFNEITGSFKHVNATYALHWNIVPWIGLMRWGKTAGVQVLKSVEDAV